MRKVYIDFESISFPFNSGLNIYKKTSWYPFALSMGAKVKSKWIIKTFLVDFKMIKNDEDIFNQIKKWIREELGKWYPNITEDEINFIAFNPYLETKIINKIFPRSRISHLLEYENIGLSRLTKGKFKSNYFEYARNILKEKYNEKQLLSQRLNLDGAIAAWVGMNLFIRDNKSEKQKKYDYALLKKELFEYSYDDVARMIFAIENPEYIEDKRNQINQLRLYKEHHNREIQKQKLLLGHLKPIKNKNLKISDLIKLLESDNNIREKMIEEIVKKIDY